MNPLKKGATGKEVLELQSSLLFAGYLIRKDGVFGPETETALKNFQKTCRLKSDGILNEETLAKLQQARAVQSPSSIHNRLHLLEKPPLKEEQKILLSKGSKGILVEKLQIALIKQGYLLGIDGIFGEDTLKAVLAFQQKNKLAKDGIVGEKTWKELLKEPKISPKMTFRARKSTKLPQLQRGSQGIQVLKLQEMLLSFGYQAEKNGSFDALTESCVKMFQQKCGMSGDGIVGPDTWDFLLNFNVIKPKMLQEKDLEEAASQLKIELPIIQAVYTVESSGFGFLSNAEPKILFEGHVFWQQLIERGISPAQFGKEYQDILYPQWTKLYYKGGIAEYERLEKAISIDEESALASASWGTFQVMGYHFKICGFDTVQDFVNTQRNTERAHLITFLRYVEWHNLIPALQNKNWAAFAYSYNGPGYKENRYDEQLAAAYRKFRKGV